MKKVLLVAALCLSFSTNAMCADNTFSNRYIDKEIQRQMEMEKARQRLKGQGVTPGPLWEGNWGGSLNSVKYKVYTKRQVAKAVERAVERERAAASGTKLILGGQI